jgi:hypothetical protein
MDSISFLNGLLDELGLEQNAEDWARDTLSSGFTGWFTANDPEDSLFLQVYVHHVSPEASGTSDLTVQPYRQ